MAARQGDLLEILQRSGRGGPRKGAGPKPKGRAGIVWNVRRARFRGLTAGHVTLRVREGVPSLRSQRLVRELQRSFSAACERGDFRLVHYAILNDHLHLIVEAEDHEALGRGMKAIGSRVARAVQRVFGWKGPVMLGRYHLQLLKSFRQIRNALRYVLLNARKHAAQWAKGREGRKGKEDRQGRKRSQARKPGWLVDPASSGPGFDGWRERLRGDPVEPHERRRALGIAPPRGYGLRTGWRRYGLLSLHEIPG